MADQDNVLLVDERDHPQGLMAKIPAHEKGVLHRAFSAYVLRRRAGETFLLLQKRALTKYHFGGLWTNTCCGHPLEGETPAQAGMRRLPQEMNFQCELRAIGTFIYRAQSENGLIEHELDHVLVGTYDDEPPPPNPHEADAARWVSVDALEREITASPAQFTPWFAKGWAVVKAKEPALLRPNAM
jgi:isopentenyl-diphosphate delta-isomerase